MHESASPRKTIAPPSALPGAAPIVALVAAIVANVALAFGPLFVRMADVGPVASGFWRLALATPLLLFAALAMGERPLRSARGHWPLLIVAGLAFAADLASWHVGIVRTTLANSTLFGNSATLIYPIYGFLVARMWPSRPQAAALLLAAIGGALLLGRSAELSPRHLAGDLFCLFAGLLYAVYFICMARVRTAMTPLPALALSSFATIPALLVLALALGERVVPGDWLPLLGLALFSQVIGQGCMIYALGHLSPLVVGITLLIQPVVAAIVGWIAYAERLTLPDLVGAVLVAAALVLVRAGHRSAPTLGTRGASA
ncbi:DMT family transporter [Sphingomonas hengshuiensis]|uniref:Permease n=1 Tax=Sphingomonas hengshuiensis TaxID=1609977 RepID=A0A7U4JB27_9SPHN|nr:DMT family transporter [Sphingomonas hengshuiensis]AJP73549.1 permease [Sphingomonas hengshuiensis]